jgi:integrase/recombinase XerD
MEQVSNVSMQLALHSALMDTLISATEWFIGHCRDHRKLSPHTIKAYRHDLDQFVQFAMNSVPGASLDSVDRNLVQQWLGRMMGLKPRTVRRRLAVVKSMFACMERAGKMEKNPLAGVRSEVKIGITLPRTVARATIRSLLRSTRREPAGSKYRMNRKIQETALIENLFSTGMRVSEVVASNIMDDLFL